MILRAVGLAKRYGGRQVVDNLNIEVRAGEIVGLLGPNGAGKTTTFYMIAGITPPTQGRIFLDDTDITDYPIYKRARLGIYYLPQEPSVFRKMSVEDNIMSALEQLSLPKQERYKRLEQLLEEFGLMHVRKVKTEFVSGGERRRTEIARAIALNPRFLLLDEPFTGIDPITIEELQKIILRLSKKNIGIIITDHNVHETMPLTDRSYLIFEGRLLRHGTPQELAEDPMVRKVYLGSSFTLIKTKEDIIAEIHSNK